MTQDTATPAIDRAALSQLLPVPPLPIGSYVATTQVGNLVYTSGVLPMKDGQVAFTGALGGWDVKIPEGQEAAKLCVLNALSLISHALGGLERVKRVVKMTGFVSSAPTFYDQPQVMNAASDLLVEYFGEAGKHVRSAVGVSSLPRNASVEVELVVEIA
ncbi:RidA family protein [Vampirovibrio sp.]|uniref:RidA family protein n=1 Tax=Vampirovibrio sp. TaxID=2717857 RepID=UPI003593A979